MAALAMMGQYPCCDPGGCIGSDGPVLSCGEPGDCLSTSSHWPAPIYIEIKVAALAMAVRGQHP